MDKNVISVKIVGKEKVSITEFVKMCVCVCHLWYFKHLLTGIALYSRWLIGRAPSLSSNRRLAIHSCHLLHWGWRQAVTVNIFSILNVYQALLLLLTSSSERYNSLFNEWRNQGIERVSNLTEVTWLRPLIYSYHFMTKGVTNRTYMRCDCKVIGLWS